MAQEIKLGNKQRIRIDKLEEMKQQLYDNRMATKVGILGNANSRMQSVITKSGKHKAGEEKSAMTNAQIGLIHEKGVISKHIPPRSFLKWPLSAKREELTKTNNALLEGLKEGKLNLLEAYKELGAKAERIIQKAFATSGFGMWPKLKSRDGKPLIDTGQLRKSITSTVVKR